MSVEGLGPYGYQQQTGPAYYYEPPVPNPSTTGGPAPGATAQPGTVQQPNTQDVDAAADRVMKAGVRPFIKDNYEERMDKFAEEMAKGDSAFRAALLNKILEKDPGAFQSWLHGDRLNWMVKDQDITAAERDAVNNGMLTALTQDCRMQGGKLDADFVRESGAPKLIAAYIRAQNLDDREGFNRALKAFSGLPPQEMASFVNGSETRGTMQTFSLAVQKHQDWFEHQTMDMPNPRNWLDPEVEAPVEFSKDQLSAMRLAFEQNDGLVDHGELLLAYPDRLERNEKVTDSYHDMSEEMAKIVGEDNASWLNFGQYASDEVGRNIDGTPGIAIGEAGMGNPKYWLSLGNTRLGSDIAPAFREFINTYGSGNHDVSFEDFWKGLEQKWGGRGISYLDGNNDPNLDMKNAFKAYYDSMKLRDQEKLTTDPKQLADLSEKRANLMLYGNLLVGLQEQKLIQGDVENGMRVLTPINGGIVDPAGMGGFGLDLHLPHDRRIDLDQNVGTSANRVNFDTDATFVTVDGKTINLGEAIHDRLKNLDGDPNNVDEYDVKNSDAAHWESYSDRMGTIYHIFSNEQRNPDLFIDPRDAFGSRAVALNNDPSTQG